MKIFFAILGGIIVILGVMVCINMLIDRQFVLFDFWVIFVTFFITLLISAIPFGIAAAFARLDKLEYAKREDYRLLERKVIALERAAKDKEQETKTHGD
ncbi:MAG: hypothetical protein FWC76_00035 [Defluviitaleaceae bacterium]|nr:hypothetical protein [Defluviitaleaceae bacterium]